MRMMNLTVDRRILYNLDLNLPERILLSIVSEAGDDGLMYGTRYLSRALNVTAHKVDVIINLLIQGEFLIDSSRFAQPGVMRLRMLYLGPKTEQILADRKINSGDTNEDYIPGENLEDIIEDLENVR